MVDSINKARDKIKGLSIYTKFLLIFFVTANIVTGSYLMIGDKFNSLQYRREAVAVSNQVIAFLQWIARNDYILIDKPHAVIGEHIFSEKMVKEGKVVNVYSKDMALSTQELSKLYLSLSNGTVFYITSENHLQDYLSDKDGSHEFEIEALKYFQTLKNNSSKEDFFEKESKTSYSYAQAIYLEKSCLQCHGPKAEIDKKIIKKYGEKTGFGYKVGDIRGVVTVTIPRDDYIKILKNFFSDVFLASILLMSVTLANFVWFRNVVSKPLYKLTSYAEKLSKRNYEAISDIKSSDEIGLLAGTMEFMASDIGKHIHSLEESKQNLENLNSTFSQFVPNEFLSFLGHQDVTTIQLGDQVQKDMSILFSDIRDFTKLSETMSPKENFDFLNCYMGTQGPVIDKNNGFIDKYIGDAIMALFPRSPDDAVIAAVEMQLKVSYLNEQRISNGKIPIKAGIGIHMGTLMLGTIGYQEHMQTTVISDSVNMASRIESLTKMFGAKILVSEFLLNKLSNKNKFKHRFLGKFHVKGKSSKIPIYEIFDADSPEVSDGKESTKEKFEEAVTNFRAKEYKKTIELFTEIIEKTPNDVPA